MKDEYRDQRFTVLLTEHEREMIRENAAKYGMNDSTYVRWLLLGKKRRKKVSQ